LRFFCQLVWNFFFLLTWSYVLFLSKDPTSSYDQCTCMREMPFIYRGHQGPVPKGHLDWKWLNKMFSLHTICFFRQNDGDAGVYSGHLGEIDKMTTIYRWLLFEGFWFFDKILHASCK
jgi:hypothetical protein